MPAKILMYSTDPCPYCSQAKALLKARQLEYEEINLARDPEGRAKLAAETGMMSFPQVIVEGTLVGGFTELLAADRSGRLAELVAT